MILGRTRIIDRKKVSVHHELQKAGMITDKMIHSQLSESVIGVAMRVLNTIKPGLNVKVL
jgi:hypothetical protein